MAGLHDAGAIGLRDRIEMLRGVRRRLTEPEDFWLSHKDEYRGELVLITIRELMPLKPVDNDMQDEEWEYHVNVLAASICAELLTELETGLRFWLSPASQPQAEELAGAAPGIFGQDTIREWVEAGRAGEEGGKVLNTQRDWDSSDAQIANRVWWSMTQGRSIHSYDLIRKFLVSRGFQFIQDVIPALVKAWREGLIVKLREDWKRYIRETATGTTGVNEPF